MKYLVCFVTLMLLLSSCSVNQQELNKAKSLCIEHEGIYEISIFLDVKTVACKDGYSEIVD